MFQRAATEQTYFSAPVWVRVQVKGLIVERNPVAPTPESLLEEALVSGWPPIHVRLFGDRKALGRLLESLGRDYDRVKSPEEPRA
jgi:hypothetical protein